MQLPDYTRKIHEQLLAASALGDERTQQIARSLGDSVESAARLAILAAVTEAASDITAALFEVGGGAATPAVTVHLVGDEVRVNVTHAPPGPAEPQPPRSDESDTSARISLRLPENLKVDIEQAAARSEVSVNTWLVRSAMRSVQGTNGEHGPGGGWGGWGGPQAWTNPGRGGRGGAGHITGWVTG